MLYIRNLRLLCMFLSIVVLGASCSSQKYLSEEQLLLDGVEVTPKDYKSYIRQQPNHRWLGFLKVPMGIYLMAGKGDGRFKRMIRRMGEAPVVYDSLSDVRAVQNIQIAARNKGYLNALSHREKIVKGHKVRLKYDVDLGDLYHVNSIHTEIHDSLLLPVVEKTMSESLLYEGMPFDIDILDDERSRIASALSNMGYYRFSTEKIHFVADTTVGRHHVDLTMIVMGNTPQDDRVNHKYYWGDTDIKIDSTSGFCPYIRPRVLNSTVFMKSGTHYTEKDIQNTYSRLMRLGIIAATNVRLEERGDTLYPHIRLTPNKLNSPKIAIDGTNNAGDLGVALELSYQNRNIFHGSELLSLKARGAFEAIKQLHGYDRQNYIEYSFEASLTFPNFKFPFLKEETKRKLQAISEVSLKYDSQDRPEFHRRVVTGVWRYRWGQSGGKRLYRLDLVNLNYVYMPWISETFRKQYLDNPTSRNAILRYNYENLFILNWNFSYNYSSIRASGASEIYGKDAFTFKVSAETAGNLLQGICSAAGTKVNADGQRTLFGIAYAQYAKIDIDFAKSVRISDAHSMAFHFNLGVAYPYGNSTILPYEKRYFSGGANSVRGWSVRELGPGSFRGSDGRIDFINQTGDIKLDMSVEYRAHLFWKVDGALFVDAGNIWTIRDYKEQPGGQFRFDSFARQIAVAYGLGVRFNFNFFILRLDAGMKAINPAYTDNKRHYAIINPQFSRDFTFNFAVGLPF